MYIRQSILFQLPVFNILDLVIHTDVAFVAGGRDNAVFYRLKDLTALLTQVVAGIEFTRTEIAVKLGESEFQFLFANQLEALDVYGGKTGGIGNIGSQSFFSPFSSRHDYQ